MTELSRNHFPYGFPARPHTGTMRKPSPGRFTSSPKIGAQEFRTIVESLHNRNAFATPRSASAVRRNLNSGWSLIEVLTVSAIVGLLIALILPAVQHAREAARATDCRSRLRQLGIAMHAYHDVHKFFPPGSSNGFSAFAAMLPFLEQESLYQRISFSHHAYLPPNDKLIEHDLAFLRCPSDGGLRSGFGQTSYVGNNGAGLHVDGQVEGIFSLLSRDSVNGGGPVSSSLVTDGLSHTAALSELLVGNETKDAKRTVWKTTAFRRPNEADLMIRACESVDMEKQRGDTGGRGRPWHDGNYPSTLYNHMAGPNTRPCTNGGSVFTGTYPAASLHHDSVTVCFADGAVRPISTVIDLEVWRALGTRSSGELVDSF